ncbi:MAG: hypothetical protein KatS3mg057_1483 [Herpetosiphonaceae bacterium]|nr:MAG: hypothetical protein KatS3mg057_1483 [Herpetosiphonaceae bacterium]
MPATGELLGELRETAVVQGLRRLLEIPDWLRAVGDAERVRDALARRIPEFAGGELALAECRVERWRLKRGEDGWIGLYDLTVDGPGDGQRRSVKLRGQLVPPGFAEPAGMSRGAFAAADWRCYIPELRLELQPQPEDAALPALPMLTDPEQSRELLEQSIAANPRYSDLRIRSCRPRVVRYKPGSRCTIVYHLEYAPEFADRRWPDLVVAKTYHGDKGRNAYNAMLVLWGSPLAKSSAVSIAEPLAYLPELRVLIQGPLREERTLEKQIKETFAAMSPEALADLHTMMHKTAAGLVALHNCGVRYGVSLTWADELAELRELIERLAIPVPQIADAAGPLLERLMRIAAETPSDPLLPSHRAFRPAQVLIHQGRISFIDFDGFCLAEPALDLSRFLRKTRALGLGRHGAHLEEEALRERLAQTDALCETFLNSYEALVPISRQRVAVWEALDLLTMVLFCWTKIEPDRVETNLLLLGRHLHGMGL